MITIFFDCKACGVILQAVQVPARDNPDIEAVVGWVNQTGAICYEIHRREHPNCTDLIDLKVPLAGAEFVGQQIE